MTDARVSRVHSEALVALTPDARVSRIHVEALWAPVKAVAGGIATEVDTAPTGVTLGGNIFGGQIVQSSNIIERIVGGQTESQNTIQAGVTWDGVFDARVSGTYSLPYSMLTNDLFVDRTIIAELPFTEIQDQSGFTLESGESNPQTITGSAWYELRMTELDEERIRLTVSGAVSTGRIVVYGYASQADEDDTIGLSNLSVIAQGEDFWLDVDDTYLSYYVQVGIKTGTGEDLTFAVRSGTQDVGETFASPTVIDGDWGNEYVDTSNASLETSEPLPAGISSGIGTASAWYLWTAPADPPTSITFAAPATGNTGDIGLRAYTGTAIGSLTVKASAVAAATAGTAITFVPVAGTEYRIQLTTEYPADTHTIQWSPAPTVQAPEPVPPGLTVWAYDSDGLTPVTEIPRRLASNFSEGLNSSDIGEISVSLDDIVLRAYPTCLDTGKFIKFYFGTRCVSAFRIGARNTHWVGSGESSDRVLSVSGPTLPFLFSDFIVHHDRKLRIDSPDTRYYSWASAPDEWYLKSQWNHRIITSTQENPPGDWKKSRKKRRRYNKPKKWPDSKSQWYWITEKTARNGGWKAPYGTKNRYYRANFRSFKEGEVLLLYLTGEMPMNVYLDGDLILQREGGESGYKTFAKQRITVSKGYHTIALHAKQSGKVGDGVDAFMLTVYNTRKGERRKVVLRTGAKTKRWRAFYGNTPPGWNRAMVLRNTIKEAIERHNDSAILLGGSESLENVEFTKNVDSGGRAWVDKFNQEVQIGTNGLELLQQLSESGIFDVWVDPETLHVYAWRQRGKDRSQSVALTPGRNLIDWVRTEEDQVVNILLSHYDGGYVRRSSASSVRTYGRRELYVDLGGVRSPGAAYTLLGRILSGYRGSAVSGGASKARNVPVGAGDVGGLIGVKGAYPFLDFNVGDVISVPDSTFSGSVRARVLAITCTEDSTGLLTFDPEVEVL